MSTAASHTGWGVRRDVRPGAERAPKDRWRPAPADSPNAPATNGSPPLRARIEGCPGLPTATPHCDRERMRIQTNRSHIDPGGPLHRRTHERGIRSSCLPAVCPARSPARRASVTGASEAEAGPPDASSWSGRQRARHGRCGRARRRRRAEESRRSACPSPSRRPDPGRRIAQPEALGIGPGPEDLGAFPRARAERRLPAGGSGAPSRTSCTRTGAASGTVGMSRLGARPLHRDLRLAVIGTRLEHDLLQTVGVELLVRVGEAG